MEKKQLKESVYQLFLRVVRCGYGESLEPALIVKISMIFGYKYSYSEKREYCCAISKLSEKDYPAVALNNRLIRRGLDTPL